MRRNSDIRAPLVLAALLALGVATPPPAQAGTPTAAFAGNPERYIVLAVSNDPGAAPSRAGSTSRAYGDRGNYAISEGARRAMREVAAQYHLVSVAAWPIRLLQLHCAVFELPAGVERAALLARLQADRRVALAEPLQEYAVQTDAPPAGATAAAVDPYAAVQSGNRRMDIAQAHLLSRGQGVRIALIDTGLASDHPDLRGRVELQRNFVDADGSRFRQDRHGTAIAGVIAANADNGQGIAGVAPEARLLALKACWQLQDGNDAAHCNSFTLAEALASAVDLKARIINLSLTGPPDPLLQALAEQAMRQGIIIVGPRTAAPSFPGSLHDVLGVARTEDRDVPSGVLQAPGLEVLTLAPGGRYDFSSGSSIATGEITGITALLLARESALDAARVRDLLTDATDSVATAMGPARTVNACRAVALVARSRQECPAAGKY